MANKSYPNGVSLCEFILHAHKLLQRDSDPSSTAILAATNTEDGGHRLTPALRELLITNGWECKPMKLCSYSYDLYILTSTSGNVFATVCFATQTESDVWHAGFYYGIPFPTDALEKRVKIEHSLFPNERIVWKEDFIQFYGAFPALIIGTIDVANLVMTRWHHHDAVRDSDDFRMFLNIYRWLAGDLMMTDPYGHLRLFTRLINDRYWQWTALSHEVVEERVRQIAIEETERDKVRSRIHAELGYPADGELYIGEKKPFIEMGVTHLPFFVRIMSPKGIRRDIVVKWY